MSKETTKTRVFQGNMKDETDFDRLLAPTTIYEAARKRLNELRKIEKEKTEALLKSPEGKIHVVKSGKRTQFYLRTEANEKGGTYIHKSEWAFIRKLLQKTYDVKVQKLVKEEIKSIETFLKHSENYNLKIQQVYSDNPDEIKSALKTIDCSDEDYVKYWESIPYEGNPMPVPTTEYKTDNGEIVRSKSEINIANALKKAGIPYKYEKPVFLKTGMVVYPDFTVLEVKKRRQIYWEHRGMMDDREYVRNAVKKTKEYTKNGIIAGKNLIITEETTLNPLGTDEINAVIKMLKA